MKANTSKAKKEERKARIERNFRRYKAEEQLWDMEAVEIPCPRCGRMKDWGCNCEQA